MKFALLAVVLLSGCAHQQGLLGEFRINESQIQNAVKTALVEKGSLDLVQSSVADLSIRVQDVTIDLVADPDGRIIAQLDTQLSTRLPFVGRISTDLSPKISGSLEIREQAIYLVRPMIESLGYQGPYAQGLEQSLGPNAERLAAALDLYFSEYPIYSLARDPKLKLASRVLKTVRIDDAGLSLVP